MAEDNKDNKEQFAFFTKRPEPSERSTNSNHTPTNDEKKNSPKSETPAASLDYDVSKVSHPKSVSTSNSNSISEHLPEVQSIESNDSSKGSKPFIPSLNLKSLSQSETKSSFNSDSYENKSNSKTDSGEIRSVEKSFKSDDNRISNESSVHIPTDWTEESKSIPSKVSDDKSLGPEKTPQLSVGSIHSIDNNDLENKESECSWSISEDVIKLDIRGTAKRPIELISELIISNPDNMGVPREIHDFDPRDLQSPPLEDMLPLSDPFNIKENKSSDSLRQFHIQLINRGLDPGHESKPANTDFEQDCDVEEMILNESRDRFPSRNKSENVFSSGKMGTDLDNSLSTVTTDYKNICDDYHPKIADLQGMVEMKNSEIENLEMSVRQLQMDNGHLSNEIFTLQKIIDSAQVGGEIQCQLSDFLKNENLVKDEGYPITLRQCENKKRENTAKSTNFTQTEEFSTKQRIDFEKSLNAFDSSDNAILNEFLLHNFESLLSTSDDDDQKNRIVESMKRFYNHMSKIISERNNYENDNKRLKDVVISIKSDHPDINKLREELESIYDKEMNKLTTYYEKKCFDIGKNYSEEIFSQHSKKSPTSSLDSLNNCPEALPFGSPMHSSKYIPEEKSPALKHSMSAEFFTDYGKESILIKDIEQKREISALNDKFEKQLQEINESHNKVLDELKNRHVEEVKELKAHVQSLENTVKDSRDLSFGNSDADAELEKALLYSSGIDLTNPLNLIEFRDRIQAECQIEIEQLKMAHAAEISSLRDSDGKLVQLTEKHKTEDEKRKQKRNEVFDKNRQIEEVIKERDGLKHMIHTLRSVLSQLVEYFNLCEDELNNTFVGEFIKQVIAAHDNYDNQLVLSSITDVNELLEDFNDTFQTNLDSSNANTSFVSENSKKSNRMSFAPNLEGIISIIESDSALECLNQSQDLSINFKNNLDFCLKKLHLQALDLLHLSKQNIPSKRLSIMSADDQLQDAEPEIKEQKAQNKDYNKLKEEYDKLKALYDENEIIRKNLEAQEIILKQQLEDHANSDHLPQLDQTQEIVSEGYGIVAHPGTPVSLPPHPRVAITSPPPFIIGEQATAEGEQCLSLDGAIDKRLTGMQEYTRRLHNNLDAIIKERDDLQMQLNAANKSLNSAKKFIEEQTFEREQERDDFQKKLNDLKEENAKLQMKTQNQSKICNESPPESPQNLQKLTQSTNVEHLENQIREMSDAIHGFESQKQDNDLELNTIVGKNKMLNDIISNLESKLEHKSAKESEALDQLNTFKQICDERNLKIKNLTEELEAMKGKLDQMVNDEVLALSQAKLSDKSFENDKQTLELMKADLHLLVQTIAERTTALENLHEAVCSRSCSSPSEDVSVADHKKLALQSVDDGSAMSKLLLQLPITEISQLGDSLHKHLRAEDAALKRIKDLEMQLYQLKKVAQELRLERDVLQERVLEQSHNISSLKSRLDQTRHTAEAMQHQSTEDLRLKLDQAEGEVRRLTESLNSRDKQVERLKAVVNSTKKKLVDQEKELSACSSKETIQRLKGELQEQQFKIRELQELADASNLQKDSLPLPLECIVADKNADIELLKQQLLEKEQHLQAILSFKLDEDNSRVMSPRDDGKLSARTLSDVLSISEFDEPEVMRRAELKPSSFMSGIAGNTAFSPHLLENTGASPRLMQHAIKEISPILEKEETAFGSTIPNMISDNCSMFPNKDATSERNATIEPRHINFSDPQSKSLKELGIDIDQNQKVYPDILTQLKSEITKLQHELKQKASLLKQAEEQLTEFPALQEEMQELKVALQNTLSSMDESKNYYENQLDRFTNVEDLMKQKLEMTLHDCAEKSKELHLLKEDIVRRENVILELSREKRNLETQLSNYQKDHVKSGEIQELEQIIREKNLQIDNLNLNLDHLDELKRIVDEKEESLKKVQLLSEGIQKENQTIKTQNAELLLELKKLNDSKNALNIENKKYLEVISQLEKELETKGPNQSEQFMPLNIEELEELQKLEEFKHLLSELDSPRITEHTDKLIKLDNQKVANIRNKVSNLKSAIEDKESELQGKTKELENAKRKLIENIATIERLNASNMELAIKLQEVQSRLREESNLDEIRNKLSRKVQECSDLEREISVLRNAFQGPEEHIEILNENERLKQQLEISESRIVDQENIILELNGMKESLITDLQTLEHNTVVEKDTSARLQFLLDNEKQMASNIQCQDSSVIQILRGRLENALDSESELKVLLEREKIESEQLHKQVDILKKKIDLLENREGGNTTDIVNDPALEEKLKNTSSQLEDQIELSELLKSETMLLKTKYDREKGRLIDLQNTLDREKLWFQKEIEAKNELCSQYKAELAELKKLKHDMHLELVHSREALHLQNKLRGGGSLKEIQRSDSQRAIIDDLEQEKTELNIEISKLKHKLQATLEREKQLRSLVYKGDGKMNSKVLSEIDLSTLDNLKEMPSLLKRHISENIHMAETIKDLTQERRELQARVRYLEDQLKMGVKHSSSEEINLPEGIDQQVRFLYTRYMRTDSYRKALLWQKKYLMRVSEALDEWRMKMGISIYAPRSKGAQRFKCVTLGIIAIIRMKLIVRRWHTETRLATKIHLSVPSVYGGLRSSKSYSNVPTGNKDAGSRHSLTNPVTSFTPVSRNPNKSWSSGSAGAALSQNQRTGKLYASRPSASALSLHQPESPLNPELRHKGYASHRNLEQQFSGYDSPRQREILSDGIELDERPPLRNYGSEQDVSPMLNKYADRIDQINLKLQHALNTSRNPP